MLTEDLEGALRAAARDERVLRSAPVGLRDHTMSRIAALPRRRGHWALVARLAACAALLATAWIAVRYGSPDPGVPTDAHVERRHAPPSIVIGIDLARIESLVPEAARTEPSIIEKPFHDEARRMITDARRAARYLYDRIPVKPVEVSIE